VSQENVERIRRTYEVPYGGQEWAALVEEFVAAECELEDRTLPEVAAGLTGPDAIRAEAAQMNDTFDDVQYAVEDILGFDDRIAVRVRGSARGKASGINGTWEETLEAVGLRE
jgi:hypothetical protein